MLTVPPSLSLTEAAQRTWPVVVVGAGPAGSFLARNLARAGTAVLLVDRARFPRWKVCGCCLNGAALHVLEAAGLGRLLPRCGAVPLASVKLSAAGRSVSLALSTGAVVSRETFDLALLRAAIEEGTAFLPGTTARLVPADGAGPRQLRLRQADQEAIVTTGMVVAADGLTGQVLADEAGHRPGVARHAWIGAGTVLDHGPDSFVPGVIYMACGRGGYVGLVRLEDGRLDVAAALDPRHVRRGGSLAAAATAILQESAWPALPELRSGHWRGTPALTRQIRTPAGEGYFVVGDAAGYVEPFTGEGIAWALASASALLPLVLRGLPGWNASLVPLWRRRLRQLLGRRRLGCFLLTRLLRRPLLTRGLVRLLAQAPWLAQPFLGLLNRPFAEATLFPSVDRLTPDSRSSSPSRCPA